MSTQVTNEDGSEADLTDHLGSVHQKGTKGFTDDYLASLHKTLHQRSRDPLPEHTHPDDDPDSVDDPDRDRDDDADAAGELAGV